MHLLPRNTSGLLMNISFSILINAATCVVSQSSDAHACRQINISSSTTHGSDLKQSKPVTSPCASQASLFYVGIKSRIKKLDMRSYL